MHLPCKQVDVGALPTDSTNFNCGENEIQVSLISFASVGATPTPATSLRRLRRATNVTEQKIAGAEAPGAFELPVPSQVSYPIIDVRFANRGPALPTILDS